MKSRGYGGGVSIITPSSSSGSSSGSSYQQFKFHPVTCEVQGGHKGPPWNSLLGKNPMPRGVTAGGTLITPTIQIPLRNTRGTCSKGSEAFEQRFAEDPTAVWVVCSTRSHAHRRHTHRLERPVAPKQRRGRESVMSSPFALITGDVLVVERREDWRGESLPRQHEHGYFKHGQFRQTL